MSSQESVLVEIHDPVMSITIQRREHLNAIIYETHVNLLKHSTDLQMTQVSP